MKEILSFFVGQAGLQISSAFWEHFCGDHFIDQTGEFVNCEAHLLNGSDRFFQINSSNRCNPRCLLLDLEPSVVDEIKTGSYKTLFSSDNYVNGFEDSASIFARGYFTQGRFLINEIMDKTRKQLENCDCVQALLFTHSFGGGTGSGLYSLIMDELDCCSKIIKQQNVIYPSFPGGSPIIVEPYNALLVQHYTMDSNDITYLMDNESLLQISHNILLVQKPTFIHANRLIAHALGIITSPTRFFTGHSSTLEEMLQNLVPYPRIHTVTVGLGPLKAYSDEFDMGRTLTFTKDSLSRCNQFLQCDPLSSKFMACCFIYRSKSLSVTDIHSSILKIKQKERTLNFVDWCPTGVKVMMCKRDPIFVVGSQIGVSKSCVAVVSNNTCVTDPALYCAFRFQLLFQKRAFIHWYVAEGMEEAEFKDSLDNIACLIKNYEECSMNSRDIQSETYNKLTKGNSSSLDQNKDEKEQNQKLKYTKFDKNVIMKNENSETSITISPELKSYKETTPKFEITSNENVEINQQYQNNANVIRRNTKALKTPTRCFLYEFDKSLSNTVITRTSRLSPMSSTSSIRQM